MNIGRYAAILAGYVIPFLAIWKLFAEGQVKKKSGKRLSYSFAIVSGGSSSLILFPGLRKRIQQSIASGDAQMEVLVFIWNSGTSAITSEDFFSEKGLRINVYDARIVGVSVDFQAHATVGAHVQIARSSIRFHEWENELGIPNLSSAEITFSYLPPLHGAIFRISLCDLERKVPMVSIVGPIRELRRTTYEGVIVSLPVRSLVWMKRLGRWVGWNVNMALAGMGGMIIGAAATGAFNTGINDPRYWFWVAGVLIFEVYYLMARDIRRQLLCRIPAKLAYWDPVRCDRD